MVGFAVGRNIGRASRSDLPSGTSLITAVQPAQPADPRESPGPDLYPHLLPDTTFLGPLAKAKHYPKK